MSFRKIIIIVPVALIIIGVGYYSATHFIARGAMKKREEQLSAEVAAFRKEACNRPPLFGKAPEGDGGFELLAVAREAAKFTKKETILDISNLLSPNPDKAVIDGTRSFLKDVTPLLSRVEKAVEKAECVVPYNLADMGSEPPPCVFRGIGFALIISAKRFSDRHRNFEAMKLYFIAARYGQDFSRKAPLKYRKVGAEVTVAALRQAMRLLIEKDVRLGNLRKLLGAADKFADSEPDFSNSLRAECFQDEYRIIDVGEKIGFIPGFVSISGTGVKKFTTLAGYAASRIEYVKWFEAARQEVGSPYPAAREMLVKRISGRILVDWLLQALTWDYEEVYKQHVLSLTFCRAIRFAVWLRVFREEKGRFPRESIEEVGRDQPIDPFSDNKKFNYIYGYGGGTRFYSIGSDATPNGGKGRNWQDKMGEDVIFPAASIFRRQPR